MTPEPQSYVETPKTYNVVPGTSIYKMVKNHPLCIVDERCGPGTTLQDGVCVLEPTTCY